MFNDNWWLFVLVVLLLFSSDGNISNTENAVLIGIVFALFLSEGNNNLFCNNNNNNDATV
ncbi:MAG TPA: hypothetical protein VJZ69_03115 [Clostridia bacterium]|nr:hypothetical protein [Clostridia bacterium]